MRRLKLLRSEYKDTQKDLANFLGINQSRLSHWETGRHAPPDEILMKIADRYGVSMDYLLGYSDTRALPVEDHIRLLKEYLYAKTGNDFPLKFAIDLDGAITQIIALTNFRGK